MKKLPYEKTDEEIDAAADAHYEKWKIDMANKKNPIEPFFPVTAEDKAKAVALKIQLHQPIALTLDYNRSITKSAEAKKRRVRKEVAQLGQQKNQSIEPLKVYSTYEWRAQERYDPNNDPKFIQLYGEAANLYGLSITEYISRMDEFEGTNK
jgi:hypothetical protein